MRSIGKLSTEIEALRFSSYLKRHGIAHTCDASFEEPSHFISYEIWVHDEDRLEDAKEAFQTFSQNPKDSAFDIPITEQVAENEVLEEETLPKESPTERLPAIFTKFILAICAAVFCISVYQDIPLIKEGARGELLSFAPIETACLYDLPPFFEELAGLLQKHKVPANQKLEVLTPEVQAEFAQISYTPYWRGVYDWCLLKFKTGDASEATGPLFIKIRQGELWRLVSPCILHASFLHILFNLIWVWILCKPIEQRIGFFKIFLLTLIIAIGSNTIQYLLGGPFFVGYSGVVMGLAGFIWSRQKIAPWEGYPIQKSTLLFLTFFVLAMFGLQLASFILQLFSDVKFSPNIANAAHIVGGILGLFLGRFRFFSWRASR